MVLLDIFNDIGDILECWKKATVIPIPKPGKDSRNRLSHISDKLFMQNNEKND